MNAKDPLSLIYAVPDHPWMKSADKAAVRIAMTVAQAGKVKGEVQVEADLGEIIVTQDIKWPSDGLDQIRSVRDLLARAESPIAAPVLAAAFGGRTTPKRRERVEQVLETLVATGAARRDEATRGYYLPK